MQLNYKHILCGIFIFCVIYLPHAVSFMLDSILLTIITLQCVGILILLLVVSCKLLPWCYGRIINIIYDTDALETKLSMKKSLVGHIYRNLCSDRIENIIEKVNTDSLFYNISSYKENLDNYFIPDISIIIMEFLCIKVKKNIETSHLEYYKYVQINPVSSKFKYFNKGITLIDYINNIFITDQLICNIRREIPQCYPLDKCPLEGYGSNIEEFLENMT